MSKYVYFMIVDQRTMERLNDYYKTEAEARQEAEQAIAEGDCPNPLYICKVVCTQNARGKTTRKDYYNMGLV